MLTFLIALITALLVFAVSYRGLPLSAVFTMTILVFFIVYLAIWFLLRMQSKKINTKLQELMLEIQQKIQGMQNRMMHRPTGSPKQMMQILEREQQAGLDRMIEALDLYKPLYKWSFLMKRQVNTMKMAFLFQQKKFDEVDKLLPKCLFFDAQSVAIKMVRMYKNNDPKLDKFFKMRARRFKGDNAVIPYAAYSWMLVKQNRIEDAIAALTDARKQTSNEVLEKNREFLLNGKVKQFSNAPLAEAWYALMLEEPKMPRIQQSVRYR
ncbi:MAG: hypothetical protein IKQ16_06030 [Lentisphaeria bacterium]|nr:hypothetical protein [Lentisphaeria bacterium]